jgi:hypothetical protein
LDNLTEEEEEEEEEDENEEEGMLYMCLNLCYLYMYERV